MNRWRVRIERTIFYSFLISLIIHFGLLFWSFFVGIYSYHVQPSKPDHSIHITIAQEEKSGSQDKKTISNTKMEELIPENPLGGELETKNTSYLSEEMVAKSLEAAREKKEESLVSPSTAQQMNAKKPEISDNVITKKVMRSTRRNLVEVGDLPQEDFAAGSPVVVSGDDISKNFLDKNNLSLNQSNALPTQFSRNKDEFQVMKRSASGIHRKSPVSEFGNTFTYDLSTYQDPQTSQKYFKLAIKVKSMTSSLPAIPKEMIFVVDASESIGEDRFQEFKEGLIYSLNNLNPEDRFNIIVFKDRVIPFSPISLKPDSSNIRQAINFLKDLSASSKTDVYSALSQSLVTEDIGMPSYRLVLTDGFPTKGVTNSRQVINEISNINNGRISIFAFSGGLGVSRYMLDFLAYKNRGWANYVERGHLIGKELAQMYMGIKDPVLLNLRYFVSGLNPKQIFPQILPDFFRGSDFVIYGLYTDENKFFLQLLGNLPTETREFIMQAKLNDAVRGGRDIARQWAFHKVYFLISQLKYNENNEAIIKEIDKLCAQFEIITPYSKNFRK